MGLQIPIVRVFARMYVLTPEEGGRKMPVYDGYRPDHFFGKLEDGAFMGRIDVPEGGIIHVGETRDLWITFIDSPGLDEHLFSGNNWRINEADRPVATAKILSVER